MQSLKKMKAPEHIKKEEEKWFKSFIKKQGKFLNKNGFKLLSNSIKKRYVDTLYKEMKHIIYNEVSQFLHGRHYLTSKEIDNIRKDITRGIYSDFKA